MDLTDALRDKRLILLPVCYGEEYELDLQRICEVSGLARETVIQIHSETVRGLHEPYVPARKKETVQVYRGAHFELFDEESERAFFELPYRFQGGNRMGYYLQGSTLHLKEPVNLLSEATMFGTIQVPARGQPIVLMADAQTVGSYPVIGIVHPDDLRHVAQLEMFEEIRFQLVEVE